MKDSLTRTYCPRCLRWLGIMNSPDHLKHLEEMGLFPRRTGPSKWDADEIDRWFVLNTGIQPPIVICRS